MTVTLLPGFVHDEETRKNFEYIESHAIFRTGGGGRCDFGKVTLSWAASTNSTGVVVVNHNLAVVPVAIVFGALQAPAFGEIPLPNASGLTKTSFGVNAETKSAFTGSVVLMWAAFA